MTVELTPYTDSSVARELFNIEKNMGSQYWSFEGNSKRTGAHSLISYPAMMVPTLQGSLIDLVIKHQPTSNILDPFVGSGTVMTEAMARNIDFSGIDINPLAILACRVKSGPYFTDSLENKYKELISRITKRNKKLKAREFPGSDKWFHEETACELECISRSIMDEKALWARRVFWLSLGRTARIVSNTRSTTYKLHKRPEETLGSYFNAISEFQRQFSLVVDALVQQKNIFIKKNLLERGRHIGKSKAILGDSNEILPKLGNKYDLIMTSPPYGDNQTTIPYGQYSYLPLHWICLEDIDSNAKYSAIENTHAIDSSSLGGSLRNSNEKSQYLCEKYATAKKYIEQLTDNQNGKKRFSTFFFDLDITVKALSNRTSNGGYHVWTVGNRRIGNKLVPMTKLLIEMLSAHNIYTAAIINREIKNKKMANRNNIASTMDTETIILARKDG